VLWHLVETDPCCGDKEEEVEGERLPHFSPPFFSFLMVTPLYTPFILFLGSNQAEVVSLVYSFSFISAGSVSMIINQAKQNPDAEIRYS